MNRYLLIALGSLGYALFVLLARRLRLWNARRAAPPQNMLEAFDHRAFLGELEELYAAGLPAEGGETVRPETRVASLGTPVDWLRASNWRDRAVPEAVQTAASRVEAGHDGQVDSLIEPGQSARIDQLLTTLGVHHFILRLYRGELDGAERLLERLPTWTNGRISPRVVAKYHAHVAFVRATEARRTKAKNPWKHAQAARKALARAGAGDRFAEPGTIALWAHLELGWFAHALNLEWVHFRVGRRLGKALAEHRHSAILFYEMAKLSLSKGQGEEAVDHLVRAVFYSGRDPFYVRPVTETPEVARIKPGAVRQVQAGSPS